MKIAKLLAISILFILSSCSKGDNEPDIDNPKNGNVSIGKPTVSNVTYNGIHVNCKITVKAGDEGVSGFGVEVYDKAGTCLSENGSLTMNYVNTTSYSDFNVVISGLSENTTYSIKGVAVVYSTEKQGEQKMYGEAIEITTPKGPVKPKKLDSFTVTTSSYTVVESAVYSAPMKQYLVSLAEHQKVDYSWSCSDSKAVGILISDRATNTPKDGVSYSSNPSYTSYYGGSGSYTIQKWNQSAATYVSFYIWTYDSNLNYSNELYAEVNSGYQKVV